MLFNNMLIHSLNNTVLIGSVSCSYCRFFEVWSRVEEGRRLLSAERGGGLELFSLLYSLSYSGL